MNRLLTTFLMACVACGAAYGITIWEEDFDSYPDGATAGTAGKWSVDISACTFDGNDHFEVRSQQMQGNDLDGEAVWMSELIAISGQGAVSVSASISDVAQGLESSDYIRLYYSLDGGAETLFNTNGNNSGNFGDLTASQSGLSGSTLQITIRVINGANTEFISFDNILVESAGAPANTAPVLAAIGEKAVIVSNELIFAVTATDADGDDIILSATGLPPGAAFNTVTNAGAVTNTFTWTVAAPTGSWQTVFTADDGTTNDSETITITVSEPSVLMITEVADPAGTGGGDYRFVEIYNAGSAPVLLEGGPWVLSKQINGGSWSDIPLIGTVQAGDTFVIAYSATKFQEAYGFPPNQSSSAVSGTGDDAYFLYSGGDHTSGTLVDIYGAIDTDGTGEPWEYTDSRAGRNATATGPGAAWIASEWTITPGATTNDMNPGAAYNLPPALSPIGKQGGLEGSTISFSVTASDLADGDPITLTAINLPTGAIFTNGTFTWNTAAPAGTFPVTFIATDKDGSDSEVVTITVIDKPLLLISEIADPNVTGGDAYRFVEIYNAGTNAIDFGVTAWHLSRQNNGSSWYDVELSGTIPAAGTWVVANSADDFQSAYGFAPDQEDSVIAGNGNDAYALFYGGNHSDGILIDIYGELDTDGEDTAWDYENSRAERIETVLAPNATWTASEWTINSGASTNNMTPGEHGPRPQFVDLNDVFVFPGDDLSLVVTAVNTVRTDIITLSATALPAGATFPAQTDTDLVTGTLTWNNPPLGTYTATFNAEGFSGVRTESIQITVSSTTQIDTYFYGWDPDTIVKLANGQFWRNTGGVGDTVDPRLRKPDVTITNVFGQRRMFITGVPSYTTVELIDITESDLDSTFSGLHNGNTYQLADGTVWKQISYENINSSVNPVTAWRWTENGDTFLRFLDRYDVVIGTCEATESAPPTGGPVMTTIDGWFRGWKNHRVFVLENGQFWQQLTADSTVDTLFQPNVTLTNFLGTGTWRMYVEGAVPPEYVEVRQRTDVVRTAIDGTFYGFGSGEFFHLQNGEWWRQTSIDSSASTRSNPEILIWSDNGTQMLEMPDEGRTVSAEQLAVLAESGITNDFSGLHYANIYELSSGQDWMQISFENISSSATAPETMLWVESGTTHQLVRNSSDLEIGHCTVTDPWADEDGDQIANATELIAGTSLYDAEDIFLITDLQYDNQGRAVLSWAAVSGRIYTVEWTPALNQTFQPLETGIKWPQNSWTDVYNSPGTGGSTAYASVWEIDFPILGLFRPVFNGFDRLTTGV